MSRTIWIAAGALLAALTATQAGAQTVYVSPPAYTSPPAVVVQPAPVRTWVPGHWEGWGHSRVWVEGHWVVSQPAFAHPGRGWGHGAQVARRDLDRDGIPDRFDRDRDGDGVPNWRDRAPQNGWRR